MPTPFTPPPTWGTQVLTSADVDTYIRDNTNFLYGPPRGRYTIAGPETPGTGTVAAIVWSTVITDPWTMRNPANNAEIIIPTPGFYLVAASCNWDVNGTGNREMWARVGASFNLDYDREIAGGTLQTTNRVVTTYPLNTGDKITIPVLESTSPGVNLNVAGAQLSVLWVGG